MSGLLKPELSAFNNAVTSNVPTNNTIQSWVLRIALYQLSRLIERADDWVIILDHTCQLGHHKCLIVLGIRQSHWATLNRPLIIQDLSVLMIRVVTSSTGLLVQQQLLEVQARIGMIAAIVSDQGSDLVCGSNLFANQQAEEVARENPARVVIIQEHAAVFNDSQVEAAQVDASVNDDARSNVSPNVASQVFDADGLTVPGRAKPLVLKDYSHASSHLLKAHLEADTQWHEFLSQCGKTQPKVKQIIWGALAPPTQKVKGRYMNIGEMIRWGQMMIDLLRGFAGTLPEGVDRSMLRQKYGWVESYAESLKEWLEIDILREQSLQVVRVSGYSNTTVDLIRSGQRGYTNHESSRKMATALLNLAREQCRQIPDGMSYPGSSEVIESLIGKYKQSQGQHSRGGFTKMLLTIGASVVEVTESVVVESLTAVRELDVRKWTKDALGTTLSSMRRLAFPGTKVE